MTPLNVRFSAKPHPILGMVPPGAHVGNASNDNCRRILVGAWFSS